MSDNLKSASEKDSYYLNEDNSEESSDDCDDSYEDYENNEFEEDNNDSKDVLTTAFDQLKLELEKWQKPDFEKVRQIISANKHLLNEPIGDYGDYVLHFACLKNAPSNIVIEFINGNPLAVQQKEVNYGFYPLHLACQWKQLESVIQLLIKEYPLAVQQKSNNGNYPLHTACNCKQSESVIQLLVKEYPLAVQHIDIYGYYPLHYACRCLSDQSEESVIQLLVKEYPLAVQHKEIFGEYPLHLAIRCNDQCENVILKLIDLFPEATACQVRDYYAAGHLLGYPLHLACEYSQSEKVLLVLINLSLHAVKYKDKNDETPLCIAKEYNQSSTIIKVLVELTTMSDYDIKNRIGIPTIVALHGLDNLRRNDIFQWVLYNSPIQIDGEYIYF